MKPQTVALCFRLLVSKNVLKARNPINPTRSEVPCGVETETLILRVVGTLLC